MKLGQIIISSAQAEKDSLSYIVQCYMIKHQRPISWRHADMTLIYAQTDIGYGIYCCDTAVLLTESYMSRN